MSKTSSCMLLKNQQELGDAGGLWKSGLGAGVFFKFCHYSWEPRTPVRGKIWPFVISREISVGISASPIGKNSLRHSKQKLIFSLCFFFSCHSIWYWKVCHPEYLLFVRVSKHANVCGFIYRAKTVVEFGSLCWSMVSVNAWMWFFLGHYGLLKSCPIIEVICVPQR